jgi:hypothetical protein
MTSAGIYGEGVRLHPKLEMLPHFLFDGHQFTVAGHRARTALLPTLLNFHESQFYAFRIVQASLKSFDALLLAFPPKSFL